MSRATILLLATIAAMLLTTGVALAATFYPGTDKNNVIKGGTAVPGDDVLNIHRDTKKAGTDGSDALYGRQGNDTLYGGCGNDNFENVAGYDRYGKPISAGLRGQVGNDSIYGQKGDDDVIGHGGDDTLDDTLDNPPGIQGAVSCKVNPATDWDRAFGGTGKDTIIVADGDTRDEVSCGEEGLASPAGDNDDVKDTVTIDVERKDINDPNKITAADKVYEWDEKGDSTECEVILEKGTDESIDQADLPQSESATAAVEPTPVVPS